MKGKTPITKTVQPEEQKVLDVSFLDRKATAVIPAKKVAAQTIDARVGSLSNIFNAIQANRFGSVKDFLEEAAKAGKQLDSQAIHQMLNCGNMKMFQSFLTDKEKTLHKFTGNQGLSILVRAASTSKKAKAIRETIAQL
jgi:pyridoxine 5'-phosphate synthase PdxJ